jgi:hypothetical protein
MISIPLPTDNAESFTQRTQLDGVDYTLRFSHNSRTDSWTLDLSAIGGKDQQDVPIVTGKKLFIGDNLLRYASGELAPPGVLFLLSSDGSRQAPTLADLGTRVSLYYLPLGESL